MPRQCPTKKKAGGQKEAPPSSLSLPCGQLPEVPQPLALRSTRASPPTYPPAFETTAESTTPPQRHLPPEQAPWRRNPSPWIPPRTELPRTKLPTLSRPAAVESDDDGDEGADDKDTTAAAAAETKKSNIKRGKKPADASAAGKPSSDAGADLKRAIDNLPPEQLAELLKMNPALSHELSGAQAEGPSGSSDKPEAALDALKRLSLQDIMTGLASSGKNVKDMASYRFWGTQPVPKFGEGEPGTVEEGPIKRQTLDDVSKEPPKLIDGFEWDQLDLTDPEQLKEVYELLNLHYVEDEQAMFRFKYSPSILKWSGHLFHLSLTLTLLRPSPLVPTPLVLSPLLPSPPPRACHG